MTRGPDKQFDRQEALDRAMQLFWRQGYTATGVSDLLDEMEIGRQSMYDTFGNKRALFIEALHGYGQAQHEQLLGILQAPGSPLANLMRVLDEFERRADLATTCGCLVGNTCAELGPHDPEIRAMLRRGIEQIRIGFAAAIRRAIDAGEIVDGVDPDEFATLIVTTAQGAALLAKVQEDNGHALDALRGLRSTLESLRPAP